MPQVFGKYLMFRNRLEKQYRHLGRIARKQGIGCFRLYDHDLPEFPLLVEVYETRLYVSEYKRKHQLSEEEHDQWLEQCRQVLSEVTAIAPEDIFIRLRKKKEGRQDQYRKVDESRAEFVVNENGLKFLVNLSDYLDTGLFLDHRLTRQMVREMSKDKSVLNLFCYTGSFSVYAVAGGAGRVVSVDLSKTYLSWAEKNMQLNFPDDARHHVVHADVLKFLKEETSRFDLVILDPPTFSNSKRMEEVLDVQRDHVEMINNCLALLNPGGVLIFSTNFTRFSLNQEAIRSDKIRDITRQTTPFDFEGKLRRPCFKIEV